METIYLDTHAVIWLREGKFEILSFKAKELIEACTEIIVSPMVVLELRLLYQIGRVFDTEKQIIDDLESMVGLKVSETGFKDVVNQAIGIQWTRDPFDRLIVANAAMYDAKLITKDRMILEHYENAVW